MLVFLKLIRLNQWVKNLLLFFPSFFAGNILDADQLLQLFFGFISFSFTTSAVYIFNDIADIEIDRLHSEKKNRPLASGQISLTMGYAFFAFFGVGGLSAGYFIDLHFFFLSISYFIINISYSYGLKRVPILDILIVSSGFVIRIFLGGMIADVMITNWLSIMTFIMAMLLVLGKRRNDVTKYNESGIVVRRVSLHYNLKFIDHSMSMIGGIIIVAYIMYCLSPEVHTQWNSDYIFLTTIYVIAGILKYLQLVLVFEKGGDPLHILFKDRFILATVSLWVVTFYFLIYLS